MPASLTEESFAENLNTKFRVRVEAPRPVELELVEIKSYNAGPNEHQGMERFSLYLYGPADIYLPQSIYTLEHERMGEIELFLVPIGLDARGYRYEIVFNYFKKGDE
jgi:hypothetical protein